MVNKLLEAGADPSAAKKNGYTALMATSQPLRVREASLLGFVLGRPAA